MKKLLKVLAVVLLPLFAAQAQQNELDLDHVPNPGNTGAYAFSFIDHANDAKIGDHVIIDLKVDAGLDKLGTMQGGYLRIKIPFAHWVEMELDAMTDKWKISDQVKDRYGIKGNTGPFDGDLNLKTKIRIVQESQGGFRPAISFQGTAKAAAGDFKSYHRYTDSAGYELSILASKTLLDSEDSIIRKVRILSEIAFIAWDTGLSEQNDALKASAGIQVVGEKMQMKISWLGYYGWQDPNVDHVSSLQLEASTNLRKSFQFYGQANIGLSKAAAPFLIGAGLRYNLPAPKKRRPIPDDQ